MTFREFMQKYKKKRKRIDNVCESNTEFFYCLARFAEKHLKKAYNAGYDEGFEKGLDKGWNECQSVHKVIDKVKVIEVKMKTDCKNYTHECDAVWCYECGKWQEKNADEKCKQCRKESYYQFCEICSVNGHVGIMNEEIK